MHPDPTTVDDATLRRISRVDLDEHVLLEFGQPAIRARLLATALVFHETPGSENERELLGDALFYRGLLNVEADVRHAELPGIGQGRILRYQFRPRRIDRLAMDRDRIWQAKRIGAGLAVTVVHAPVPHRYALYAARQVGGPRHGVWIGGANPLNGCTLGLGE